MKIIDAKDMLFDELDEVIRNTTGEIKLENTLGQRFIAAGSSNKKLEIHGIPGNALGAYLNGSEINVLGNAQDAVGDTMNDGIIIVNGNIGDAAGYAMRGGKIYVKGNAGYRAGIHMKAYKEKIPVMIIGGTAGSFLGEYQAGGVIIVLNLEDKDKIVGDFPCTGMHGGMMLLRSSCDGIEFPKNVSVKKAEETDIKQVEKYILDYCEKLGIDSSDVLKSEFTIVTPDSKNPYKQMYVAN